MGNNFSKAILIMKVFFQGFPSTGFLWRLRLLLVYSPSNLNFIALGGAGVLKIRSTVLVSMRLTRTFKRRCLQLPALTLLRIESAFHSRTHCKEKTPKIQQTLCFIQVWKQLKSSPLIQHQFLNSPWIWQASAGRIVLPRKGSYASLPNKKFKIPGCQQSLR